MVYNDSCPKIEVNPDGKNLKDKNGKNEAN